MNRFVRCGTVLAIVTALAALVGGARTTIAAPVPKGAGKADPTPDLTAVFDTTRKAVKAEKWPDEDDESLLKNSARVIFERALKAADQKARPLPVDFDKLTKLDVTAEYAQPLDGKFLITGTVVRGTAKNSVIFASERVQLTIVENCVIVAPTVRVSTAYNCTIIAGDHLRLLSSRKRPTGEGSVLVAGQWLRASILEDAVCHVIKPGTDPAPDDPKGANGAKFLAIQTARATRAVFLNAKEEARITQETDITFSAPKFPLAK